MGDDPSNQNIHQGQEYPPEEKRSVENSLDGGNNPLDELDSIPLIDSLQSGYSRPPVFKDDVQVNETQKDFVSLLAGLMEEGVSGYPEFRRSATIPDHHLWIQFERVLKPLLMVLIILILLISFFFGGAPDISFILNPELLAVYDGVSELKPGSRVLLAVDFLPGSLGEMEFASLPVVSHLIDQQVFLILVSTHPTGLAQADRLIRRATENQMNDLGPAGRYLTFVNAGYIPGGSVGLAALAESPAMVLNGFSDTLQSSESGLETGIRLSDLSAVIVITESPETARLWIEQVQPSLIRTSMYMVLSAQAEPGVRPYINSYSPQLGGMVVGVPGGMAYQTLSKGEAVDRRNGTAFLTGIWISGILFAILGGVSLVYPWAQTRKNTMVNGDDSEPG